MLLALRGLEPKTTDPYLAGWRLRVVPALGHLPLTMVTNGAVDRTVFAWITDGEGRSTVKNSLAILVRVMEQAVRDGLITVNPARVKGWQRQYQLAEDELDDPRVARAARLERAGPTRHGSRRPLPRAARRLGRRRGLRRLHGRPHRRGIRGPGEGHRPAQLDLDRAPTDHALPGGLADKNTKGKVARRVPLIEEVRPMIARRLLAAGRQPDARLFTGPRGGRITTAVLRDATHWDEVVRSLGYDHLRRHDLRHTGLTWLADAGVPLHVLRIDRRPRLAADDPALPNSRELHQTGEKSQVARSRRGLERTPRLLRPSCLTRHVADRIPSDA